MHQLATHVIPRMVGNSFPLSLAFRVSASLLLWFLPQTSKRSDISIGIVDECQMKHSSPNTILVVEVD